MKNVVVKARELTDKENYSVQSECVEYLMATALGTASVTSIFKGHVITGVALGILGGGKLGTALGKNFLRKYYKALYNIK